MQYLIDYGYKTNELHDNVCEVINKTYNAIADLLKQSGEKCIAVKQKSYAKYWWNQELQIIKRPPKEIPVTGLLLENLGMVKF